MSFWVFFFLFSRRLSFVSRFLSFLFSYSEQNPFSFFLSFKIPTPFSFFLPKQLKLQKSQIYPLILSQCFLSLPPSSFFHLKHPSPAATTTQLLHRWRSSRESGGDPDGMVAAVVAGRHSNGKTQQWRSSRTRKVASLPLFLFCFYLSFDGPGRKHLI